MKTIVGQIEDSLDFRIPPEQLARLPRQTILHYNVFVEGSRGIKNSLQLVSRFLEGENELKPVELYQLWVQVKMYYEQTLRLCNSLRSNGNISSKEREKILAFYKAQLLRALQERMAAEPKISVLVPIIEAELSAREREAGVHAPPTRGEE